MSGKIGSEFTTVDQTIRTMERSIMDEIDQKIRSLEQSFRTDMETSRAEVRETADSVQKLATKDEVQKVRDDVAGLRDAIDAQTEMMQKLLQLLPSEQPVASRNWIVNLLLEYQIYIIVVHASHPHVWILAEKVSQ